jgi:multidrug resistance efflux pump
MDFPFGVIIKVAELEARIQTANNTVDSLREDLTAKNGELQLLLKVLDSKDKLHKRQIESLYTQILVSKDALHKQEMDYTKQKLNITASILILALVGAGIMLF